MSHNELYRQQSKLYFDTCSISHCEGVSKADYIPSTYQNTIIMAILLTDWRVLIPNYFVRSLNALQWLLDIILQTSIGYSTRRGWKSDQHNSETNYEKAAQLVM